MTSLAVSQSELLRAQMSAIETCLERSTVSSRRLKVTLAGVHEALRRRLAEVESEPEPGTVETLQFDASLWAGDSNARLEVYTALVARVRQRIRAVAPCAARVAIASRGDERLTDVPGVTVSHFPQGRDGRYAGYYPRDGEAALAHLLDLVAAGTEFFVLPAIAYWWLDHYVELADYLRPLAIHSDEDCTVYDLRPAETERGATT